jgi:hypothetical protein
MISKAKWSAFRITIPRHMLLTRVQDPAITLSTTIRTIFPELDFVLFTLLLRIRQSESTQSWRLRQHFRDELGPGADR